MAVRFTKLLAASLLVGAAGAAPAQQNTFWITVGDAAYAQLKKALITPLVSQLQATNIGQTITDLSAFTNRYYTTTAGRSDITVSQFTHTGYPQKSVILTINGTDNATEVVVLGARLDSIVSGGVGESTRAPGADDDASGIASLTEALRVMLAANYKPPTP